MVVIENAMVRIKDSIGRLPIVDGELDGVEEGGEDHVVAPSSASKRVLADGTYATESAYSAAVTTTVSGDRKPSIRSIFTIYSSFCPCW